MKNHLLIFMATLFVAGSFLASFELAQGINPVSLTLMRFIAAALILAPIALSKKGNRSLILKTLPGCMVVSFFFSFFFIGFFESLKITTTLNTGTLYTLVPLGTALLSMLIFKERLPLKRWAAYAVAVVGTLIVVFKGDLQSLMALELNKGDLIFSIACISMCCYSISMKFFYKGQPMPLFVLCTLSGGVFWMSLALLISGEPFEWYKVQGSHVFNLSYLVIFATLLSSYLFQYATVNLGPRKVMGYIYLNPALVAILLFIVKGQSIDFKVIIGILVSFISTIILLRD